MKKIQFKAFIAIMSLCLFVISCKKNTSTTTNTTIAEETAEARMQSDDNATVEGETESVDDDVNNTVASSARFCGQANIFLGTNQIPFDLDTITSGNTIPRIILHFNGRGWTGFCKKRTGTITVDLVSGARWVDAGAVLKYTFNNFTVTDTCRNRSVTINGERFVTNVNGGNLALLRRGTVSSLVHRIRTGTNGITATFSDTLNNTKTAYWNVAKKVTITAPSITKLNFRLEGDTTFNGNANVSGWGTTRNVRAYQTTINTAVEANTECRLWRPTSGNVTHKIGGFTAMVTYGLNAAGTPSVGCGTNTHYRVDWTTSNGNTGYAVIPYR